MDMTETCSNNSTYMVHEFIDEWNEVLPGDELFEMIIGNISFSELDESDFAANS